MEIREAHRSLLALVLCATGLVGCSTMLEFENRNQGNAHDGQITCGNGQRDPGEECDGNDLGQATCADHGFYRGTPSCDETCHLDLSNCSRYCGDGVLDKTDGEECDGPELDGRTCETVVGAGTPGSLVCDNQCRVDRSGCQYCGNDRNDPGEACDGQDVQVTCAQLGYTAAGSPTCRTDCTLDPSPCAACQDGRCDVEAGETQLSCAEDCGWVQVSAGLRHTCGVRVDGSGWCWGLDDWNGSLGIGPTGQQDAPARISGYDDWLHIEAGQDFSCGSSASQGVLCWGSNAYGRLGTGDLNHADTPVKTLNLGSQPATRIALGQEFACALVSSVVWCWGLNDEGQLGRGFESTTEASPQMVSLPGTPVDLVAGAGFACAVNTAGELYCWGAGDYGQLGTGQSNTSSATPLHVASAGTVTRVAAGGDFLCTTDDPAGVSCWGDNSAGQLGIGTVVDAYYPVAWSAPIPFLPTTLDGGIHHACGQSATGETYCWGSNATGALGVGGPPTCAGGNDHATPVLVMLDSALPLPGANVISAGPNHSCAVTLTGQAYCWGQANGGALGIGPTTATCVGYATPVAY